MDYLQEQLQRRLQIAAGNLRRELIVEGEDSDLFADAVSVEPTDDGARVRFFAGKPEPAKSKGKGKKSVPDVEADDFKDSVA